MKLALILAISIALFLGFFQASLDAQSSLSGVAVNVEINDSDVAEGKIIAATKDGLKLAREADEAVIYGVVVSAPVLSVRPKEDNTFALLSNGEAGVLVSNKNGNIEAGDMITVSADAGVGQKATKAGYILGKALASYDKQDVGFLPVLVNPGYFSRASAASVSNVLGYVLNFIGEPGRWRYILAGFVFVVAFLASTIATIKFITTGIEAIGRNPLARSTIVRSMVVSSLGAFVLAALGFLAGMAIIRIGG